MTENGHTGHCTCASGSTKHSTGEIALNGYYRITATVHTLDTLFQAYKCIKEINNHDNNPKFQQHSVLDKGIVFKSATSKK
jgi:hypothetical protein